MLAAASLAMTDMVLNVFIFVYISYNLVYRLNTLTSIKIEVAGVTPDGIQRHPPEYPTLAVVIEANDVVNVFEENEEGVKLSCQNDSQYSKITDFLKIYPGGTSVLITADKKVKYDNAIKVIDAVTASGLTNVSLTQPKENDNGPQEG